MFKQFCRLNIFFLRLKITWLVSSSNQSSWFKNQWKERNNGPSSTNFLIVVHNRNDLQCKQRQKKTHSSIVGLVGLYIFSDQIITLYCGWRRSPNSNPVDDFILQPSGIESFGNIPLVLHFFLRQDGKGYIAHTSYRMVTCCFIRTQIRRQTKDVFFSNH